MSKNLDALMTVIAACKEGMWAENGVWLLDQTFNFMESTGNYYWFESFQRNPTHELRKALEMNFHDWKFSDVGRNRKQVVGSKGIQHRTKRLADLGVFEDSHTAKAEGRFNKVATYDSPDEEQYRAEVPDFDLHLEVLAFVRDFLNLKPQALLDWVNTLPACEANPHTAVKKLLVQGNIYHGSLQ
ncbi:unnamed protein product [Calypogeia fissa]